MSIDLENRPSEEIKNNVEIKKSISGILLAGIFLLLVSSIFLTMQIILAFKLHWSFDDFSSILCDRFG